MRHNAKKTTTKKTKNKNKQTTELAAIFDFWLTGIFEASMFQFQYIHIA